MRAAGRDLSEKYIPASACRLAGPWCRRTRSRAFRPSAVPSAARPPAGGGVDLQKVACSDKIAPHNALARSPRFEYSYGIAPAWPWRMVGSGSAGRLSEGSICNRRSNGLDSLPASGSRLGSRKARFAGMETDNSPALNWARRSQDTQLEPFRGPRGHAGKNAAKADEPSSERRRPITRRRSRPQRELDTED